MNLFWRIFPCPHPLHALTVETTKPIEEIQGEFTRITVPLRCHNCGEPVKIGWLTFTHGVEAYMGRGPIAQGCPGPNYGSAS